MTLYEIALESLGGGVLDMAGLNGKAVLIANVASKCGLTSQYEQLQALYDRFNNQGLEIIGCPCNQFMEQEPGTADEILSFCSTTYGVTFPLSAKLDVNGPDRHPLYEYLAGDEATFPGDIEWNFAKFLVNRQGEVVARFHPRTRPDDPEVNVAISNVLAGALAG